MEDKLNKKFSTLNSKEDIIALNKIVFLQKFFRKILLFKKIKKLILEKIDLRNRNYFSIKRIREKYFYKFINENVKKFLCEFVSISNLSSYNIDNFLETFDNPNFNRENIFKNLKKNRFHFHPLAIINSFSSLDFDIYWGEWDLNGNREGFGMQVFCDSSFYFGTFKNNKLDGVGIYVFPDRSDEKIALRNYSDKVYKIKEDLSSQKLYMQDSDLINSFNIERNFITNVNYKNCKYYLFIGEFHKNNFDGNGEIYQNNELYYSGKFKNGFTV